MGVQQQFFLALPPGVLGRILQRFFNLTLYVFTQIKQIKQDFHLVAWVMPKGWDLGVLGVKSLFFPNLVMWHIKLKGMMSRTGHK